MFWRKNLGITIIIILSLLPVVEWLRLAGPSARFYSFAATMASLGQVCGLVGMAMFSLNLILAGRLKSLDNLFYGLNNVYNYHRQIGAIGFSLLLFHPLFLAVSYLQISVLAAARLLLPIYDTAVTYGIISLLLMIILLGLTFYGSLKYHHWKITHKLMLVAFLFGLFHILSITSDVSGDPWLKTYLVALSLLGLGLGAYRAILSYFLSRPARYRVEALKRRADGITEIIMKPEGRSLNFTAGQFVFVRFNSRSVPAESHPFSVSSAPEQTEISLTIKSLGDFTAQIPGLAIGDLALLEGPFGKFSHQNGRHKSQIWIAGGIGITPFLSMIRGLRDQHYSIDLYYCVGDEAEAVFLPELKTIAQANPGVRIIPWYSKERGYITGQAISGQSGLQEKDVFICGPANFMANLKKQLRDLHVATQNIHSEEFKFL